MDKFYIRLKINGQWFYVKDHTNDAFLTTGSFTDAAQYTEAAANRMLYVLKKWIYDNTEDYELEKI